MIMDELEAALAQQAPPPVKEDPSLYELPPLIIDGIPTPVEKMTQAQLRAFIPLMLKYSTGNYISSLNFRSRQGRIYVFGALSRNFRGAPLAPARAFSNPAVFFGY